MFVYCDNNAKQVHVLCGQSANFVNFKVGGPRRVVTTVLRGFDVSLFAQRTSYRRAAGCSEGDIVAALRLMMPPAHSNV